MHRHWHYAKSLQTKEELCRKVKLYLSNIELFPFYQHQCQAQIQYCILQGFMSGFLSSWHIIGTFLKFEDQSLSGKLIWARPFEFTIKIWTAKG